MATFNTILCPVDFSPATSQVVAYAKDLAQALGARLILLHVSRPMLRFTALDVGTEDIARFAQAVHDGAVKNMHALKAELLPDMDVTLRVETGYPADIILAVAKEAKADLIVMGTHGFSGLKRMVFGSVAEKITKTSPVPVLTVRPYKETLQPL
ncbi:MAG: universal stress protein [Desulfovibrio sp.]|nr:universal stress protein [Desulfovibrio sp.]